MSKQSFTTSSSPKVIVDQVGGDLQVKGWDQPECIVNADPEDLQVEQQEDTLRVTCHGDCMLRLPQEAAVEVAKVDGDASVKFMEGPLTLGDVGGSLEIRQAAAVTVEVVHRHLAARSLTGELKATTVYGHAELRDLEAGCWLEEVHGNLDVRDAEGDLHIAAHGNARLRLSEMSGTHYEIQAGGNIHCHIPDEANLKLQLSSGAGLIRLKLPDGTRALQQNEAEITLGSGEVSMKLTAGATISLLSQQADWPDQEGEPGEKFEGFPADFNVTIAREVESQITAQMENMSQQITQQMSRLSETIGRAGLSPEETQRILEHTRLASERATGRAQEKMRRAQEKLERKLEAAQRRRETQSQPRDRRSWGFSWPVPPTPPNPPAPPAAPVVSEEERLMILRMLEQKKISLEEADRLLAALEGKE